MSVTKRIFPKADYHQYEVDAPTASGLVNGDIVDVKTALGGRPAKSLSIDAAGEATIRLNVCQKIFGNHGADNSFIPFAGYYPRPVAEDEIEVTKDNIVVSSGDVFSVDNHPIEDFKVVAAASGVIITFL